jgi:hypothetical protein
MAEVVHNAPQEFWRPPAAAPTAVVSQSSLSDACDSCGAEFILSAQFCHVCGTGRKARMLVAQPNWTRYFEFHNIKQGLGLPLPSLIAFLAGVGCLLGAMIIGTIYAIQNFADFQAIQLWRMEWLLGAVAAFVAGILLKSSGKQPE